MLTRFKQESGQKREKREVKNMPKELENKLKKQAKKKGYKGKRFGAYVYGTLQKITNWKPGKKKGKKK